MYRFYKDLTILFLGSFLLFAFLKIVEANEKETQYDSAFAMQKYIVDNDPDKQVFLGDMYYFGDGISTERNYNKAFDLYQRAAEQGNAEAQYNLGLMYYSGKGVDQDYKQAKQWLEKSANQNYAKAQHNLEVIYYVGDTVDQDYKQARFWFEKAAKQNHAGSQFNLGVIYEDGKGVRQDITIAKEWFGKSCDNGSEDGCDSYKILD